MLGAEATIEHVTDRAEFPKYRVMMTPALVVNEKVVCAGRVPPTNEVMTLIANVLAEEASALLATWQERTHATDKTRVLFICTHNSARSQMAEGFLSHLGAGRFEAYSAGTEPGALHPLAVQVMAEAGHRHQRPAAKSLDAFLQAAVRLRHHRLRRRQRALPRLPQRSPPPALELP